MPGTERTAPSEPTNAVVAQLTIVGWLLLGGQFGFILFQTERVRTVGGTRFATAWDQRIEVLSFLMLPPNLGAIAVTAFIATLATVMAGPTRAPWLDSLVRITAGISIVMLFIGVASIIEIGTRAGTLELDAVFLRLGGMSLCAGLALLCRIADTSTATAPVWPTEQDQSPRTPLRK